MELLGTLPKQNGGCDERPWSVVAHNLELLPKQPSLIELSSTTQDLIAISKCQKSETKSGGV